MRLAIYHNLPSGGAKRALFEWTRRLSSRHHIDVFTLESADHDFCDIRPFVHEYKVYPFTPHRLYRSPFGRLNQIQRSQDLKKLQGIHVEIARRINERRYDLAFVNPSLYTHVPPLLRFLEVPSIYYLHEPVGQANERKIIRPYQSAAKNSGWRALVDGFDPFMDRYHKELEAIQLENLEAADYLLGNSEFTMQQMRIYYGAKISALRHAQAKAAVCYLGIDAEYFHPLAGIAKTNALLSVGELTARKGFDFLIDSLALIPKDNRPILRLASNWEDANERKFLADLSETRQVKVDFLGRLDNDALRREYNQAQLCVYAPIMEPFGLVPLEAMACSLPVVGTAEGGVCETIQDQHNGFLVQRDPIRFAEAVSRLLADQTLSERLGSAGRQTVLKRWSWERAVERLETRFIQAIQSDRFTSN